MEFDKLSKQVHRELRGKPVISSKRTLIRCDGNHNIGLGHIVRCMALADRLSADCQHEVSFAVREGRYAVEFLRDQGYEVSVPVDGVSSEQWLLSLLSERKFDLFIADLRDETTPSLLNEIRKKDLLVALIDDASERRFSADFIFYPPVPQLETLDWFGFTGKLCVGWEWVILRQEFSSSECPVFDEKPNLLITMGGSDPVGLTMKVLHALKRVQCKLQTTVVTGAEFSQSNELASVIGELKHSVTVKSAVTNMAKIMAGKSIAITSFGTTAYELAAVGVPAIYLSLTEDHALSAAAFDRAAIGISLGLHDDVDEVMISQQIESLLSDTALCAKMSIKGRESVDGLGASRIAQLLDSNIMGTSINS